MTRYARSASVASASVMGMIAATIACSSNEGRLAAWGPPTDPVVGPAVPLGMATASSTGVAPPATMPAPPFDVTPPQDAIAAFARGRRHACVVRASGAVDCWGQHRHCERMCTIEPPADPSIRRAAGIDDAIALSEDARCAIRRGGSLACLRNDRLEFEAVAGIADVRAMDGRSRCVLQTSGRVACRRDGEPEFRPIAGVTDAIALTSTTLVTCVVRRSGHVACVDSDQQQFAAVRELANVRELAIAGDIETRGCAVIEDRSHAAGARTVRCFALGPSARDELAATGVGGSVDDRRLHDAAAFANARDLTLTPRAENDHVLEALVDGTVVRQSLGAARAEVVPVLVDAVRHVHGCALRKTGTLACWGDNNGGTLAQHTTIGRRDVPPSTVVGVAGVIDIALATSTSYALTRDGQLYRWGSRWRRARGIPERLVLGHGPKDLVDVAASSSGAVCVRSATGAVWCELTDFSHFDQLDTERVAKLVPADRGVWAIRSDGIVEFHRLWLDELEGLESPQLAGALDFAGLYEPRCARFGGDVLRCRSKPVGQVPTATAIAAGYDWGCAIRDRRTWCWTDDGSGPSGARELAKLDDATDLAASRERACAVYGGGRVGCWYFDGKGAAGDVHQVLASGVVDVEVGFASRDQYEQSLFTNDGPAPGGEYACVIMDDRTVRCWGSNLFGELGDGSLASSDTPLGVRL